MESQSSLGSRSLDQGSFLVLLCTKGRSELLPQPLLNQPVLFLLVRLLQSTLPAGMTKEPKIAQALQTLLETRLGQSLWPVTHRPVWAPQPGAALHPQGLVCLALCSSRMTMSSVSTMGGELDDYLEAGLAGSAMEGRLLFLLPNGPLAPVDTLLVPRGQVSLAKSMEGSSCCGLVESAGTSSRKVRF